MDQPPWTYNGEIITEDDLAGYAVVYWIFDETCYDIKNDGYVGVTRNLNRRLRQHSHSKRFPSNFEVRIIFKGIPNECHLLEKFLRPVWNIGWNKAPGGNFGFLGGGEPLPDNVKQKLSEVGKKSWTPERRDRHKKKLKGNQNARGKGKPKSEEHKQKIKDSVTLAKKKNPPRRWTDEERQARSLMMKKIWEERRATTAKVDLSGKRSN